MGADRSFPLDAEQIVRLTGAVLAHVLNAIRHPDARKISEDDLIVGLGEVAGVSLRTADHGYRKRLLPYEAPASAASRPAGDHSEGHFTDEELLDQIRRDVAAQRLERTASGGCP